MTGPSGQDADAAVRALFGERWAATGLLEGVVVVAVRDADAQDVARLQALVPGAGLVAVPASRADLEALMDAVEEQLTATGELAGFLQMAPDGFHGTVRVVVDAPVPRLRAWADARLPPGVLQVDEQPAGDAPTGAQTDAQTGAQPPGTV